MVKKKITISFRGGFYRHMSWQCCLIKHQIVKARLLSLKSVGTFLSFLSTSKISLESEILGLECGGIGRWCGTSEGVPKPCKRTLSKNMNYIILYWTIIIIVEWQMTVVFNLSNAMHLQIVWNLHWGKMESSLQSWPELQLSFDQCD